MNKNSLIKGTLIITITSLITRLLGFVYRMQLSNTIGADQMGLYQINMTIIGIAMSICAGALTTGVSKYVAQSHGRERSSYLTSGLMLSITLSIVTYYTLDKHSVKIAELMLIGAANSELIRLMAIALPFASIHSIISGYYYGMQKVAIPSVSTLLEQIVRVGTMYIFPLIVPSQNILSIKYAFYSMIAGEITSCAYSVIGLMVSKYKPTTYCIIGKTKELFSYSLPLTLSRLLTHLLQGIEAVLIPAKLTIYGLPQSEALAQYGCLTGMALPFILLPTIVTNAISVLLLPIISQNSSDGQNTKLNAITSNCLSFVCRLGIFCTGIFVTFGKYAGAIMFANEILINYIETLAFLCPFLFLSATIGSTLNGLGYSKSTSAYNCYGIIVRLLWIMLGIPSFGIIAYMYGLLVSQISVFLVHYIKLYHCLNGLNINYVKAVLFPVIQTAISIIIAYATTYTLQGLIKYLLACVTAATVFGLFSYRQLHTIIHQNCK